LIIKKWICIGDYIINPDYFNLFYIENIPSGEWVIFGEDKNQISWKLLEFSSYEYAEKSIDIIFNAIRE